MLTDLVIEDYQSVREARLRLGLLTVITGPTGSGKSAVIRALRLAAFNARGNSFIRHGAKTCKVAIGDQDQGWAAGIERGGRGKDSYRLVHTPQSGDEPHVETYTKLAGEAPEDVRRAHGLTALNFAGQFDRPFLLDDSGAQVARMLGELTNVSLVFEAAREAARRKAGIASELTRTRVTVTRLGEEVRQYAALPAQRAAQVQAEQALERAEDANGRALRLIRLVTAAEDAEAALGRAETAVQAAEPPSLDCVAELESRCARLRELVFELGESEREIAVQEDYAGQLAGQEAQAHQAVHDLLIEAGTCPTCGQAVH